MRCRNRARTKLAKDGLALVLSRGPRVSEPQRRENVKPRFLGTAIVHGDTNQDIFWRVFCVFDKYVEISVVIEDPRIKKFIFKFMTGPLAVHLDEIVIRELALRILIEELHV